MLETVLKSVRWRLEIMMIPSVTEIGAFGLLYIAPSFLQVTMDCDHVPIPKALSMFANGKELFLQFEITMRKMSRQLNIVPRVPLRSDGLELTQHRYGPRSGTLLASRAPEHNGVAFFTLESRREKRRDGSVCRQVSPLNGQLKILRDVVGPSFYSFDVVGVRGFAMLNNTKLSPHELPNTETFMRPDIATHVLRMNG
jgi:hypothetical protein